MDLNITVELPYVWGQGIFEKNEWGAINFIVGANGTGKSLFAEKINSQISKQLKTRFLSSERLAGFEKEKYEYFTGSGELRRGFNIAHFDLIKSAGYSHGLSSDAYIILKEQLLIKIKIEALLSDVFKKRIRLIEEGGFLKPKIQNIDNGEEYELKRSECHGLKELITLLTFLYDNSIHCLIIDEPELHLHPQFQSFLMQEIRKVAGNTIEDPSKKIFFIITHSPYIIDIKDIEDLKNVIVCHLHSIPTYIDHFDTDDEFRLKKLLPRLNTHHKQFFFSQYPVFVEGYTDQQIYTFLLEKLGKNVNSDGSCIIDVSGKDDLDIFFRICKKLKIDARFIADLDILFEGKLKRSLGSDDECKIRCQEEGLGTDINKAIGEIESKLIKICSNIENISTDNTTLKQIIKKINSFSENELDKKRYFLLLALYQFREQKSELVSPENKDNISLILGKTDKLIEVLESCNIYVLKKGEIENYYKSKKIDFYNIGDKNKLFNIENEYILNCEKNKIITDYKELIEIITKAIPTIDIDLKNHIKYVIMEWINKVQLVVERGEVDSEEKLIKNAIIEYNLYNQIFDIINFNVSENREFICKIKIKGLEKEIIFNEKTTAYNFKI